MVKQLKAQLAAKPDDTEVKDKLLRYESNLNYIKYYPFGYKYVSLYPKEDNDASKAMREKMMELVRKKMEVIQNQEKQQLNEEIIHQEEPEIHDDFFEEGKAEEEAPKKIKKIWQKK